MALNFIKKVIADMDNFLFVDWTFLVIIFMCFLFINIDIMFSSSVSGVYKYILLGYIILFITLGRYKEDRRETVLSSWKKNLIWFFGLGIFFFILSYSGFVNFIPDTSFRPEFTSIFFALIWYFIIGYTETKVFCDSLVHYRGFGRFWSSLIFALFHLGTYTALALSLNGSVSLMLMIPMFISAFLANLIFIFILEKTNSIIIPAFAHMFFDLAKLGYLAVVFGAI
jgi:hypothetical protein